MKKKLNYAIALMLLVSLFIMPATAHAASNTTFSVTTKYMNYLTEKCTSKFDFSVNATGTVKPTIWKGGKKVATLASVKATADSKVSFAWNGKNSSGKYAAPGKYVLRLTMGSSMSEFPMVINKKPVISRFVAQSSVARGASANIYFKVSSAAITKFKVYNSKGTEVYASAAKATGKGKVAMFKWSGKDKKGNEMKEGTYTVKAIAGNVAQKKDTKITTPYDPTAGVTVSPVGTAYCKAVFDVVNRVRLEAGYEKAIWDDDLAAGAQAWIEECALNLHVGHNQDGTFGYEACGCDKNNIDYAGESLADHCYSLVDEATHIGVGAARRSDGRYGIWCAVRGDQK